MVSQGANPSNEPRHSILIGLVAKLRIRSDMTTMLTFPLIKANAQHPGQANHLFTLLTGIAEDIQREGSFDAPTTTKTPQGSFPVVPANKNKNKNKDKKKSSKMCPFYREGAKECKFGDQCNRTHEGELARPAIPTTSRGMASVPT